MKPARRRPVQVLGDDSCCFADPRCGGCAHGTPTAASLLISIQSSIVITIVECPLSTAESVPRGQPTGLGWRCAEIARDEVGPTAPTVVGNHLTAAQGAAMLD